MLLKKNDRENDILKKEPESIDTKFQKAAAKHVRFEGEEDSNANTQDPLVSNTMRILHEALQTVANMPLPTIEEQRDLISELDKLKDAQQIKLQEFEAAEIKRNETIAILAELFVDLRTKETSVGDLLERIVKAKSNVQEGITMLQNMSKAESEKEKTLQFSKAGKVITKRSAEVTIKPGTEPEKTDKAAYAILMFVWLVIAGLVAHVFDQAQKEHLSQHPTAKP